MALLANGYLLLGLFQMLATMCMNLEACVHHIVKPAVTGQYPPEELERNFLAVPARFGGLGIVNPVKLSSVEYDASTMFTGPLQSLALYSHYF